MEEGKEDSGEIAEDNKQSDGELAIKRKLLTTTDAGDGEEKPVKRRSLGFYERRQKSLPLSLPVAHDWQQDRLEADSLLRSLYRAHREDEIRRRCLLTRWPEWIEEEGLGTSVSDAGRFIPEMLLRDDDYDSIRDLVRGSFGLLQEEPDEQEALKVPYTAKKLSDEGVLEAVPILLPKLKRTALHSVLNLLRGRKTEAKNHPWLVKKADHEWRKFERHSRDDPRSIGVLQRLVSVLRDPKSFLSRGQGQSARPLLLEASCPWSAARSALLQLELLPLQCLQVMLEVLHDKGPAAMSMLTSKLPIGGGSKERVIVAIERKAKVYLALEQLGKPLPERLRKALVVMSVSARYALGNDSNLIDFLGPLPLEIKILHDRLLSALSDLENLNYDGLKVVHDELIGGAKVSDRRHPNIIRQPIKMIFLNHLLRSDNTRFIPEEVKKAIVTVAALAGQHTGGQEGERGRKGEASKKKDVKDGRRGNTRSQKINLADDLGVEREIEATLRISSHLQQIMRNWMERLLDEDSSNGRDQSQALDSKAMDGMLRHPGIGEIATGRIPDTAGRVDINSSKNGTESTTEAEAEADADEGNVSAQSEVDALIENDHGRNRQSGSASNRTAPSRNSEKGTPLQLDDGEEQLLEEVEDTQRLVRIADGAAEIAYALVGCAMEWTARACGISVTRPTSSYLRSKLVHTRIVPDAQAPSGLEESITSGRHQLSMVLNIAEQIPDISSRILENVKRRLGTG